MGRLLTRNEIRKITETPSSTLRGIIKRNGIEPERIRINAKNRPILLYTEEAIERILEYKERYKERRGKRRCAGGCGKYYTKDLLCSGLCRRCWIRKAVKNMLTMNHPEKNAPDVGIIRIAEEIISEMKK